MATVAEYFVSLLFVLAGATMLLLAAYRTAIAAYKAVNNLSRTRDSKQYLAMRGTTSDALTRQAIIQMIEKDNPGADIIMRWKNGVYCLQKFYELLKVRGYLVNINTQMCSYSTSTCFTQLTLMDKKGRNFFIVFNDTLQNPLYEDGRPKFNFVHDVEDQVGNYVSDIKYDEQDAVRVMSDFHIGTAKAIDANDGNLIEIRDLLQECEIDHIIYPPEKRKNQVRMFSFEKSGDSYRLRRYWTTVEVPSAKNLDLLYAPVGLEYATEKVTLRASDTLELCELAITDTTSPQNVYIWGTPGTGKSTWLDILASAIQDKDEDTIVIKVPSSTIKELESSDAMAALKAEIADLRERNGGIAPIVLLIDEAENLLARDSGGIHSSINTLMLSILDGSDRRELGCTTVLAFNAPRQTLNAALFRTGRAGLILELNPIPAPQAKAAAALLQQLDVENKFAFNQDIFNTYIETENKDIEGKVYSPKGFITLADLTKGCFQPRATADKLRDAIKAMAELHTSDRQFAPKESTPPKLNLTLSILDTATGPAEALPPLPLKSKKRRRGRR